MTILPARPAFVPFLAAVAAACLPSADPPREPEARALAFLAREVPKWSAEKKCYSCHNNGDAARALFAAVRHKRTVPAEALTDTSRWLAKPSEWDGKTRDGATEYGEASLARIQFAAALAEATAAGVVKDKDALRRAADLVARDQQKDGSWKVDAEGVVGSPATYGPYLATRQARDVLRRADADKHREAVARADRWLRAAKVKTVLDAAAVLSALEGADDRDAVTQRRHCLELVRKGQTGEGGWGPYLNSAAESFDTAVVLLALARHAERAEVTEMLRKGRAYLLSMQEEDGNWAETTRPTGRESYAQRLSTTGWATLALLESADK